MRNVQGVLEMITSTFKKWRALQKQSLNIGRKIRQITQRNGRTNDLGAVKKPEMMMMDDMFPLLNYYMEPQETWEFWNHWVVVAHAEWFEFSLPKDKASYICFVASSIDLKFGTASRSCDNKGESNLMWWIWLDMCHVIFITCRCCAVLCVWQFLCWCLMTHWVKGC